jgi:hypothetical protein
MNILASLIGDTEDLLLVWCDAMPMGEKFRTFKKNNLLSSSAVYLPQQTHQMKAPEFF